MDILYLLVPLSIVLVFVIGAVLWYAIDRGQFDDLEGPGLRILTDDDTPRPEGKKGAKPQVAASAPPSREP